MAILNYGSELTGISVSTLHSMVAEARQFLNTEVSTGQRTLDLPTLRDLLYRQLSSTYKVVSGLTLHGGEAGYFYRLLSAYQKNLSLPSWFAGSSASVLSVIHGLGCFLLSKEYGHAGGHYTYKEVNHIWHQTCQAVRQAADTYHIRSSSF